MGDSKLDGTGRHLSSDELFIWTRFLDASRLIEHVLARHLASDHDMLHSEYEVLVRLDGGGGSMRLRTLAEQVVSSKSRLTHTLDRLSDRGWIERRRTLDDRRGLEAVLTASGRHELRAAAVKHAELIREHLLSRWTPDEGATIGLAMDRVAQALRAHP